MNFRQKYIWSFLSFEYTVARLVFTYLLPTYRKPRTEKPSYCIAGLSRRGILVYIEYIRMSVSSSELGPAIPPPASKYVSPLGPNGGTFVCGWAGGGPEFVRLDRKPGTQYTLCRLSTSTMYKTVHIHLQNVKTHWEHRGNIKLPFYKNVLYTAAWYNPHRHQ